MDTIKENKSAIITVVVLLVVLVGGYFLMRHGRPNNKALGPTVMSTSTPDAVSDKGGSDKSPASAKTEEQNPTATASGGAVSVADQSAADSVQVKSVSLSQAGWVAIRDDAGRTLGAGWFPAGTHENVTVPLLRSTEAGQRYQALLYFDDGNKKFDLHGETLVQNTDGSVVGTTFSTSK